MNFREGFKRIYVLFSVIVLLIGAGTIYNDLPNEDRVHWLYLSQVKEEVAAQLGMETYNLRMGTLSNREFINKYCRNELIYSKNDGDTKLHANKATCDSIQQQITDLPSEIAKKIALGLGYLIAGAFGLLLVYLVCKWIFNGFFPKN